MSLPPNQVIHGDCLEVMPTIPDKSIDMILCDLPYGTTACKWDTVIPFEPLWKEYKRLIKDNGAIVLTASQPFTSALVMSNPDMFKYEWIWDKVAGGNPFNNKWMPMKVTENILVFGKSRVNYYPLLTNANPKNIRPQKPSKQKTEIMGKFKNGFIPKGDPNLRYPKNLIKFDSRAKECNSLNRLHPTQKPVALFEYLIRTYTNEGETVLDNCIGSGTTAIACINTNRKYIGIEKEEKYVNIARERISNHTQQQDIFSMIEGV